MHTHEASVIFLQSGMCLKRGGMNQSDAFLDPGTVPAFCKISAGVLEIRTRKHGVRTLTSVKEQYKQGLLLIVQPGVYYLCSFPGCEPDIDHSTRLNVCGSKGMWKHHEPLSGCPMWLMGHAFISILACNRVRLLMDGASRVSHRSIGPFTCQPFFRNAR